MKSFFLRNKSIVQLSGANTLVLALPTLLLPIFSRLYSVSDFAAFGMYSSVIGLFLPYLSGHYQQAIPVPQERHKIKALTRLSIFILVCSALAFSCAWYFINPLRSLFDPNHLLRNYFWWIPAGLLLAGYVQILQHWILQGGMFTRFASAKSAQAISQSTFRYLGGVKAGTVPGGLIYSYVIGLGIQGVIFGRRFNPDFKEMGKGVREVAKEYASFFRYGLTSAGVFALANFLPLTFLAHYFSDQEVGQYSLALRIGSVPVFVLASSFGQVYFSQCKDRPSERGSHTYALLSRLLKLSAPAVVLGLFLLEPLGTVVLGKEWGMALRITLILLPGLWLNFLVLPLTNLFELGNRQDLGLVYALFSLLFKVGGLFLGLYLYESVYAVMAVFMVGMVVSNLVGWYLCHKIKDTGVSKLLINKWYWVYPVIFLMLIKFIFFYS